MEERLYFRSKLRGRGGIHKWDCLVAGPLTAHLMACLPFLSLFGGNGPPKPRPEWPGRDSGARGWKGADSF